MSLSCIFRPTFFRFIVDEHQLFSPFKTSLVLIYVTAKFSEILMTFHVRLWQQAALQLGSARFLGIFVQFVTFTGLQRRIMVINHSPPQRPMPSTQTHMYWQATNQTRSLHASSAHCIEWLRKSKHVLPLLFVLLENYSTILR